MHITGDIGFRSLRVQLRAHYSLTLLDGLANVAHDVLVIFILNQILVLYEIEHSLVDHLPEWCTFPMYVGVLLAFRDPLDAWAIVLSSSRHDAIFSRPDCR